MGCNQFLSGKSRQLLCVMGAGPGDPELLTLRAARRLGDAAVVLYDNLANKAILELTAPTCKHIYVGKISYGQYTPQERIHELIAENIHHGMIVRLKGGDPFIFGRGFEEVLFARSLGIETEYIPGISSMQAFGFENIPLTHRGLSESIWAITATNKENQLSQDLQLAIQSKATVVIYMGLKKLPEIASIYCQAGKADMPAAIIQSATLAHSKFINAPIKDLPWLAEESQIQYPAIILIGQVASLGNDHTSSQADQITRYMQNNFK